MSITPRKPQKIKPLKAAKPQKTINRIGRKKSAPTPDPLAEVEYTGNVETDAAAELTAMQKAYRERAKNEDQRFYAATDSEYWCCVCFQDRAERERFMAALGQNIGTKYITGEKLAAILGFTY